MTSRGEYWRIKKEQKLEILRAVEQPCVTETALCRPHALAPRAMHGLPLRTARAQAPKSECRVRSACLRNLNFATTDP